MDQRGSPEHRFGGGAFGRLPIGELQTSRRAFLRNVALVGLGATGVAGLVSACGGDEAGGQGTAAPSGASDGGIGSLIGAAPDGTDLVKPGPFDHASETLSMDDVMGFQVPKAKRRYKMAVMPQSLAGEYFIATVYAAKKAADEAGVDLTVITGEGFASPDVQLSQLSDLLQKNIDAVMLMPADVNGSVALVELAHSNDIVMTVNGTLLNSTKVAQAVQSDYAAGQQCADILAETLGGSGGKGVVIAGPKQAAWASLRVAGFEARLKEKYPDITIAAIANQNFVDPAEGLNTFLDAVQRVPDIDWIYAVDYNILEAGSIPDRYRGKIRYVAMGLYGSSREALKAGTVNAIVGLLPGASGMLGLSRAVQQLNGEDVPAITIYPSPVYTADNIDDPASVLETYPAGYKP
ncbi:MAG TPA: sugar ABC transporter substrate-binding protein [Actinomycetes bacterium]|nr:sugar ABC transporter substrate-binding protein [Actinomycetes bacterium]